MKIGEIPLSVPLIQAPMAGFSNYAFREMIRHSGGCGLTTTEMVNARSFIQIEKNLRHSPPRLWGIPSETRPVAVQIWDNVPENLAEVGRVLSQIWKVSVIDINFGCPSPTVSQRSNSGAYLLDYPEKIESLVRLTVQASAPTPVTVKMRLGTKPERITVCEAAQAAQCAGAAAVYVHGRTASQGYSGQADWDEIAKVKSVLKIPLIGNGDIKTPQQAIDRLANYPVDGLMIGRGSLGKPWIFKQIFTEMLRSKLPQTRPELFADSSSVCSENAAFTIPPLNELVREHFELVCLSLSERDAVLNMRKIVCRYAEGRPGACEFRNSIAKIESKNAFLSLCDTFFE